MTKRLWFRRKLFGWGWYPITWEGWGVTLLFVTLVAWHATTTAKTDPRSFALGLILFISSLFAICFLKGESPRWQWGKRL